MGFGSIISNLLILALLLLVGNSVKEIVGLWYLTPCDDTDAPSSCVRPLLDGLEGAAGRFDIEAYAVKHALKAKHKWKGSRTAKYGAPPDLATAFWAIRNM